MSAQDGWIYWDDAEARGPVNVERLTNLVQTGNISASTDIRRPSDVAWKPAGTVLPDLFNAPSGVVDIARAPTWTDIRPHPWRRYAARMVDSTVVGGLLWTLLGIAAFATAPVQAQTFFAIFRAPTYGQVLDLVFTQLVVLPCNALTVGLTGLSLGKWVFGVRVLKQGSPMGVAAAVRREFAVFFKGLGCGIPILSLFTLTRSFTVLSDERITPWDRAQRLVVTHRGESKRAAIGMWLAVILLVMGRIGIILLSRK